MTETNQTSGTAEADPAQSKFFRIEAADSGGVILHISLERYGEEERTELYRSAYDASERVRQLLHAAGVPEF